MGTRCGWRIAAATVAIGWSVLAAAAQPAAPVERLRVVGGLASLNQFTRYEEPFWTKELPRLTGGRVRADIVPFDRAGLGGEELLRVVQLGSVPFATLLLSRSASIEPELSAPDLAGISPDIQSARRLLTAYRPRLAALLRERYGAELLAVYLYPAQVVFCTKPFGGLADLRGRRVRVSSATQADFIAGLGGQPVQTPFAQIVDNVRSGAVDCAITGTMSGNTIGLHQVTSHVHAMAINWGMSAFVANSDVWRALSPELQTVLQHELPLLEQRIWAAADSETQAGLACNTGQPGCRDGQPGRMTLVAATARDDQVRADLLRQVVVPAWLKRCGDGCARLWRDVIDGAIGGKR